MLTLSDVLSAPFAKPHFPGRVGLQFQGVRREGNEVIIEITDPSNGSKNVSFAMDAEKKMFVAAHPMFAPHLQIYGAGASTSADIILLPLFVLFSPLNIAGALLRSALSYWKDIHYEGRILIRELKERLDPETMKLLKDCLKDSWRRRAEIPKVAGAL